MNITYASLEFFAAIMVTVLLLSGIKKKIKTNKYLKLLAIIYLVTVSLDGVGWLLVGNPDAVIAMEVLWAITYTCFCSCAIAFHLYLMSYIRDSVNTKKWYYFIVYALYIIAVVLWIVAAFTGLYYTIDVDGNFEYNNAHLISQILPALIIVFDCIIVICYRKLFGKRNAFALLSYGLLPVLCAPFIFLMHSAILVMLSTSASILLIYIITNIERDTLYYNQSAEIALKEKEIAEARLDLADKQFKIMYSQIQPHFLYNVLNTIYYLCDADVERGKKAIVDFSDYLRMNLDSLNQPAMIDFSDELKKTDIYLSLEKMRFEDELEISYDIETKNFKIPQLTLQPLIENAVKHGICHKKGGGTVTIRTREQADHFELIVEDDGVGFDTSKPFSKERSHIGLSNIRYRLYDLCNGTLEITSKINVGTCVTIKIPKEAL